MSESKKKCRQYNIEYLKYGFIQSPTNLSLPMCLICERVFSNEAMKPSRLKEHLTKIHADKKDKNLSYFQTLEKMYCKQPTVSNLFESSIKQGDDGLRASYNISLLIAKAGKPHTIGEELIVPAVKEVINTVLHKSGSDVIRKIPLSNSSVQRRIDEMAEDVETSLCDYLKTCKFSIQLDESTLQNNEALLLSYVRFIKDENVCQELLFAKSLVTDTKGESIFNTVNKFFQEKCIPLSNILSAATDGAPAMTGCHKGFLAFLKKAVPNLITVHCVIHRQHLVAKNLTDRLHMSLQYVINAINKIRGNSLSDRLFSQLSSDNDEDYNRLLLHTEVRCLSKRICLNRFYSLLDTVLEFLENRDESLQANLMVSKNDIAYLTDLYDIFNEVNLQLQGDDLNLIKTKGVIAAFVRKLLLFKQNLGRGEYNHFPNLEAATDVKKEDLITYCQHLDALYANFNDRYKDVLEMDVPEWILNPFAYLGTVGSSNLDEELIELITNEELKVKFKNGYQAFWLQKLIPTLYPGLWDIVQKYLIAFPSTYLVERGFSAVTNLITKKRNRLQITERGDLRLFLTNFEPDTNKLSKIHQAHPSH